MKRAFIVHGWDGHPQEGWFPWLKRELEARGFEVHVPQLPEPARPRIGNWVPALAHAVGTVDEETFFIGHSIGCQTIARYLASLPEGAVAGGAVFVAGFFTRLTGLEDDPEVQATDKHWLGAPLDLRAVRARMRASVAIFSDDDPWVPLDNQGRFRDELGSKIRIEHARRHFSGSNGITELPSALEAVLELAGR